MTAKDLDYYREHSDELPDDPDMLDALYDEANTGVKEEEPAVEPAQEDKKEEPEEKQNNEEKELLARDGKNKIPYSVLENTRAELTESQRQQQETAAELEKMKAEIEALKTSTLPDNEGDEEDAGDADNPLDNLIDEYGDTSIAEQAKAQAEKTETIEERLDRLESEKAEALNDKAEKDAAEYEDQVNNAINNNPTLKAWRDDPDQWDSVQAVNSMLMAKDEWQQASLEDLSNEIVRRLGGETKQDAAVAEVDTSTTPTIKSLSDMPTGDAPRQTVAEEVGRMSDAEFRIKYDNCRDDSERDALLDAAGM